MTQFMKKAFGGIRKAAGSLAESAEDPRTFQPDQREPHMASLRQVQNARYEVDVALEHLVALAEKARASLISIDQNTESDTTSQRFAKELQREVEGEIASIGRQEEHLRRQQEVLLMSERRLVASIRKGAVSRQLDGATTVSSQAKEAADSALRDAGTDMQRLDAVINRARVATERLEDRSKLIDQKSGRSSKNSAVTQTQLTGEARLIANFEDLRSGEFDPEITRLAENGHMVTNKLVSEYQQLEMSIQRHQANPLTPGARLAIRAARTYRQGLSHADTALESLTAMTYGEAGDSGVAARSVSEDLAQVGRTESAIYRARLEFIAVVNGDSEASVEAVFDSLEFNNVASE
ncbi:MAG: hypothetical protein HOE50_10225 [Chloroflexi bacterium]|nr:hypothetical protein [Chloroflexota bacterium]